MQMRRRHSARINALDDLADLRDDVREYGPYGLEEPGFGNYIVENPDLAEEYRAAAVTLLNEGRNLLNGKSDVVQKLGGGLLRVHFSNDELSSARWR